MKAHIASLIATAASAALCLAQSAGNPEDSGLIPRTPTFYVNTNYFNNGGGESPGVAIAANGNVIIGWEDDGSGIADFEAVWSLFDSNGILLTPATVITNFDGTASITNTFLSYFRPNGTPTPGAYAFAPKIKANLFGNGIGMGAVAYDPIGSEIGYLEAINQDDGGFGDFPAVQILNNDGTPAGATAVLTGVTDADAQPAGNIRIADWDYLSNGNILIVDESRQNDDLINRFGGTAAGNHATFRIVTPAGVEVKSYTLVSATPTANSIWHGAGVTSNGFAVRFNSGGTTVRMFDNAGNPTTGDIKLATLTGIAGTGDGGRGDGTGFHGNGKDAYVYVNTSGGQVYVTVLNADGSLRYARNVAETNEAIVANRVDGAIAPDGRVIAVWESPLPNARGDVTNRLVQARLFSASGQPLGGRFVVSEWENPANTNTVNTSEIPRVAWRGNTIAITWLSRNAPTSLSDPLAPPYPEVVATRLFTVVDSTTSITMSTSRSGNQIQISWTGGTGPYLLQKKSNLDDATWQDVLTTTRQSESVALQGATAFFRVADNATNTVTPLTAFLSGDGERPQVTTGATGLGSFSLEGNTLTYNITFSGLSAPATAAHIHGPTNTTGSIGVIIPFSVPAATSGTISGSVVVSDQYKGYLLSGLTYANIHNTNHGGGEIRGQIGPTQLKATLNGANEQPTPVATPGTGTGTLTRIGNQLLFNITYSGLSSPANAAHIHGRADTSTFAGVLMSLPTPSGTSGTLAGTLTLDNATLSAIVDGLSYVNIHTQNNGSGEIRGQITPQ